MPQPARFWGTKANSLPPAWKSTAFRASMVCELVKLVSTKPWGLVILDFYSVSMSQLQSPPTSDGKYGTGDKYFIPNTKRVDVKDNSCVSMESQARSIWLGRGTGPVWRRRLTAYSKPGCVPEYRIGGLSEKSGRYMDDKGNIRDGGNCIELDHLYLGAPGVEQQFDVRLMYTVRYLPKLGECLLAGWESVGSALGTL
ncbi:predicted protein [Coccidioides posadasii str. Silveira]|uniref:Predicted protein n=1 Tax=Coccidioides posadasii (strain RMSCC 757 / Silveira) TaxID=443226 RepID=E9DBB2_COCPS|nr:predicted protein [Coccidioides posadasii str. Silveira]